MRYLIVIDLETGDTVNCWSDSVMQGRILVNLIMSAEGVAKVELCDTKKDNLQRIVVLSK